MNFAYRYVVQSSMSPSNHPLQVSDLNGLLSVNSTLDVYVLDIRISKDYTLSIPNQPKNCNSLQKCGIYKAVISKNTFPRPYSNLSFFNVQKYLSDNTRLSKTISTYSSNNVLNQFLIFQTEQEAVEFLEKIKNKLLHNLESSIKRLTDNFNFIKQL